jgi:hypothetical protein
VGIPADVFVATNKNALYCSASPESFADRIDLGRYTVVEMAQLWAIQEGREYKDPFEDFLVVADTVEDSECDIARFPGVFTEALAALAPEATREAAAKWAAIEEFQWYQLAPDALVPDLERLTAIARRAIAAGQHLYLWNSP